MTTSLEDQFEGAGKEIQVRLERIEQALKEVEKLKERLDGVEKKTQDLR